MITLEQLETDPYAALGVRKFINATCHHTMFGGTLIPEPSLRAMRAAADHAVDMMELQKATGRVISQYTHADDGFIVSGCAAGMLVGTAAILTGSSRAKMEQLPYLEDGKNLCIAKRFARKIDLNDGTEYVDHGYALAVQTAGVKFVEVGQDEVVTAEEFDSAFNENVAMVYWVGYAPPGDIALQDVIEIAHAHDVPVLVDASNSLPPRENLHHFIDMGADLVCFSGGKGLQGPQGAGIVAGRADLIDAVAMQSAPNHGIGRVAKVSKEEVVAQISSLIWWAEQDDEDRITEHHRKSQLLAGRLDALPDCTTEVVFPDHYQRPYPTVHVTVPVGGDLDGAQLIKLLREGEPAIAAMTHPSDPSVVRLDVRLLEDSEIEAIGRRLQEIMNGA